MTDKELEKEAEDFIIERYGIDKCYRADTEETRQYMSIDVHNDYEEEYQCYLAGAEPREKRIEELKIELAISEHDREHNDYELVEVYKKFEKLEKENAALKEKYEKGKELVERMKNVYLRVTDKSGYEGIKEEQEIEDFIKELDK